MRSLALLSSLILAVVFSFEARACGDKKYDLQTEVEINGQVTTPKITAIDRETVVKKSKTKDGVETGVQVFAEEIWDDTHQGDAVKLDFKVFQNKGRQSLGDANVTVIAPYGQAAEVTVRGNAPNSKPVRVKVTAKKL